MSSKELELDGGRRKGNPSRLRVPWWRRTYLVNRELQFRFARTTLIMGTVSSAVSAGMILWAFWAFNIWQGQRLPHPVTTSIVAAQLVNFGGLFVVSILATHRIVGPLFNLLRQFHRLGRGDFNAVAQFRSGDEMHYVARRFNEMVVLLKMRNDFVFARVEEAARALEEGDEARARTAIESVREMRQRETAQAAQSSESVEGQSAAR